MKLISACLLGIRCSYSGDDRYRNDQAVKLSGIETLIPVCPEQLGGLPTPRPPQEIQDGEGKDVLLQIPLPARSDKRTVAAEGSVG